MVCLSIRGSRTGGLNLESVVGLRDDLNIGAFLSSLFQGELGDFKALSRVDFGIFLRKEDQRGTASLSQRRSRIKTEKAAKPRTGERLQLAFCDILDLLIGILAGQCRVILGELRVHSSEQLLEVWPQLLWLCTFGERIKDVLL